MLFLFERCKGTNKRVESKIKNKVFDYLLSRVTDWTTLKMKHRISISTQRHRDTEFLFFSVSLYLCVVFIYDSENTFGETNGTNKRVESKKIMSLCHGYMVFY